MRAELRALAAERSRLLEEITSREAELRPKLADFGKSRRATVGKPGRGGEEGAGHHEGRAWGPG